MRGFQNRDLRHPITAVTGVRLKGRDKPETVFRMVIDRPLNPHLADSAEAAM